MNFTTLSVCRSISLLLLLLLRAKSRTDYGWCHDSLSVADPLFKHVALCCSYMPLLAFALRISHFRSTNILIIFLLIIITVTDSAVHTFHLSVAIASPLCFQKIEIRGVGSSLTLVRQISSSSLPSLLSSSFFPLS